MEMPDRGREPYNRDTEPRTEPRPIDRAGVRESRIEPVDQERYVRETRVLDGGSMLQWGPIWGGLLGAFALMLVLGLLGLAVGLGAGRSVTTGQLGTASLIWGVIVALVSFFVGGWIAGRTTSYPRSSFAGFMIGSVVWALGTTLTVILSAVGIGGAVGAAVGVFGVPDITGTPGAASAAQAAAIGSLIALVLSYIVTVLGAMAGINARSEYDVRVR